MLNVLVTGKLACFTRADAHVDRVSYPMMTPTAAKGILECIHWKPEFQWRIVKIAMLKPVQWTSLTRNEMKSTGVCGPRRTTLLYDVAYVISAEVVAPTKELRVKHFETAKRRLEEGKVYRQPYFGCREFVADVRLADGTEKPVDRSETLGPMPLEIEYDQNGKMVERHFTTWVNARLDHGVFHVPEVTHVQPVAR